MEKRSVTHATFRIERRFKASPARVFAAWSTAEKKRRWFACHDDWVLREYSLDFRVGGREALLTTPPGEEDHRFEGHYEDIVPDQRIVYAYGMYVGDTRISVSLVTLELEADGSGTRFSFTEQGAYLDGHQTPQEREEGTRLGLENLATELERA